MVRVTCPALLQRYQKLAGLPAYAAQPYSFHGFHGRDTVTELFFNLGWLKLNQKDPKLKDYMPNFVSNAHEYLLVVVDNNDIAMIHDMALYRQSRVSLKADTKIAKQGAFFNVEALPEGTILAFPIALRKEVQGQAIDLTQFLKTAQRHNPWELYFGGLESIGFGRTQVTLKPQPLP